MQNLNNNNTAVKTAKKVTMTSREINEALSDFDPVYDKHENSVLIEIVRKIIDGRTPEQFVDGSGTDFWSTMPRGDIREVLGDELPADLDGFFDGIGDAIDDAVEWLIDGATNWYDGESSLDELAESIREDNNRDRDGQPFNPFC